MSGLRQAATTFRPTLDLRLTERRSSAGSLPSGRSCGSKMHADDIPGLTNRPDHPEIRRLQELDESVRFSRGIPFQMRLLSPLVECSFKSLSAMVSPIMPVPLMAVNGCQMSDVCHHLIIQSSSILAAFMSTTYLCLCLSRNTP